VSETEPEKKGWFARFRSRGTPAVETPKPVEPEFATPEPPEPAAAAEPGIQVEPPPAGPPPVEPAPVGRGFRSQTILHCIDDLYVVSYPAVVRPFGQIATG